MTRFGYLAGGIVMKCVLLPMTLGLVLSTMVSLRATPPLEADPMCRSKSPRSVVERFRSELSAAPRSGQKSVGLLAAPKPAELGLVWDATSQKPWIHLRGQAQKSYQVEASAQPIGPWDPLLGLQLESATHSWPDRLAAGPARFYRVQTLDAPLQLVDNFRLVDLSGKARELWYHTHLRGVALVAAGSQLSELTGLKDTLNQAQAAWKSQGVELWIVLSDSTTPRATLAAQAASMGLQPPIVTDRDWVVARAMSLSFAGEALLVRAPDFTLAYRGPVIQDGEAMLNQAVEALVQGKTPRVWTLGMNGNRVPRPDHPVPSYSRDIGPILRAHCATCHRPGGSAPFAMTDHGMIREWAVAMRLAILGGEMPPWHPDAEYPAYKGSLALPIAAKQQLLAWLADGAPRGDGPDPLLEPLAEQDYYTWPSSLGPPDAIVEAPEQTIAATGIEPYRYIHLWSPNETDRWLKAAIILPSNREVTHHYIVYMDHVNSTVGLGFTSYVPGMAPRPYPEGTGIDLDAKSPITFELHYTPNGQVTTDRPKMALWYHKTKPAKTFVTIPAVNNDFLIPPGSRDHPVVAQFPVPFPVTLYSVGAHMHLRGKSMTIEVTYPNGSKEVLMALPKYNFHWQMRYELVEPKRIPIGTRVRVSGTFDNSPENPDNPDPKASVRWGEQSHEEMFIGVLDVAF